MNIFIVIHKCLAKELKHFQIIIIFYNFKKTKYASPDISLTEKHIHYRKLKFEVKNELFS